MAIEATEAEAPSSRATRAGPAGTGRTHRPSGEPVDIHFARADAGRARALTGTASPFTIEVRFLGGLTDTEQAAFAAAADRWARVIVGDLPDIQIGDDLIDDVLILAQGKEIDGPGRILGSAHPTHVRVAPDGSWQQPCRGEMSFDVADLAAMTADGTLRDVITHEMGHVLGIGGGVWDHRNLVADGPVGPDGLPNPVFVGPTAMAEYGWLVGGPDGAPVPVPVENHGGSGTFGAHWRESVFDAELMTGFVDPGGNPMSRVTVGSLADLGYDVDLAAADPYTLPSPALLADRAGRRSRVVHPAAAVVGPGMLPAPEPVLVVVR